LLVENNYQLKIKEMLIMYVYELVEWSNDMDNEGHIDEYVVSDKLYDKDEFNDICNKSIEEVKKIHGEVTNYVLKQHLILHYGFKKLEVMQSFGFTEEYN
jgi:hypothetical protein